MKSREQGFALILALLALMLLTFLGLTLATTTSTELQIATNYRWSQQAYYNAEAGIEAAKIVLRDIPGNWAAVLYPAPPAGGSRAAWNAAIGRNVNAAPKCGPAPYGANACAAPAAAAGAARNWEGVDCDTRSGTGFGVVLANTTGGVFTQSGPPTNAYEHVTSFRGFPVVGSFTLWIRRALIPGPVATQIQDDPNNDVLILTSEGVAPTPANAPGAFQQSARAVRLLQVQLTRNMLLRPCEPPGGQVGAAAGGANFGACVDSLNMPGGALENQAIQ